MLVLGILFLLICLVQFTLIVTYRQPQKLIAHKLLKKSSVEKTKTGLMGIMILLYIIFFIQLDQYHQPQPLEDKPYVKTTVYPTVSPNSVEELGARKTASIINLYFLYKGSDKTEITMATVAHGLRDKYCVSPCIINIYDDKTAFEKDIQRVTITSNVVMENWNRQNYVFVADHYLGYLDAVQDAQFVYYPFHDGYYKRVKSGSTAGY